MPRRIVECVPNVSEGRRPEVIEALAAAIRGVPGVRLLHQDPGFDANRTVFTFAGPGEEVLEAAFQLFVSTTIHVDMRQHTGSHPRMGAVDVCPFVPLTGADLEYCRDLANRLARRVWTELGVPVYCYEAAATSPHRRNLAAVRKGEYEGLSQKMRHPEWYPDYGTSAWNPQTGTSIIGARPFLIAWNINLASANVELARKLAAQLRGSGTVLVHPDGTKTRKPGEFPGLKAIGWSMPENGIAQVSTNVVAPDTTSLYKVYDRCAELAAAAGDRVTGSELIGLIPEEYLRLPGGPAERSANLDAAVRRLGLGDLEPFAWRERVLEELLHR